MEDGETLAYHRFIPMAHFFSALAGLVVFLMLMFAMELPPLRTGGFRVEDLGYALLGAVGYLFYAIAFATLLTAPATYIAVLAARHFRLSRYWQFAALGSWAAAISAMVMYGSSLRAFLVLIPSGVVGGLTYRFSAPRVTTWEEARR